MENNNKPKFEPMSTEEKRNFAAQFTEREKESYRKGQRNAYSHMANTAKRQSYFTGENIKKDYGQGQIQMPLPAASAPQPKTRGRKNI